MTKRDEATGWADALPPDRPTPDATEFLQRLRTGWEIVPSSECSEAEIAIARGCGRMLVVDSLGYVLRPNERERWLHSAKADPAGGQPVSATAEPSAPNPAQAETHLADVVRELYYVLGSDDWSKLRDAVIATVKANVHAAGVSATPPEPDASLDEIVAVMKREVPVKWVVAACDAIGATEYDQTIRRMARAALRAGASLQPDSPNEKLSRVPPPEGAPPA